MTQHVGPCDPDCYRCDLRRDEMGSERVPSTAGAYVTPRCAAWYTPGARSARLTHVCGLHEGHDGLHKCATCEVPWAPSTSAPSEPS